MSPRCTVVGCGRLADTEVEGDNIRTGEALPSQYVCDRSNHQFAVALAMLPPGTAVSEEFGQRVQRVLDEWNQAEAGS